MRILAVLLGAAGSSSLVIRFVSGPHAFPRPCCNDLRFSFGPCGGPVISDVFTRGVPAALLNLLVLQQLVPTACLYLCLGLSQAIQPILVNCLSVLPSDSVQCSRLFWPPCCSAIQSHKDPQRRFDAVGGDYCGRSGKQCLLRQGFWLPC